MNDVNVKVNGTGFFGLLAILFIGLKLGGVIDWPWWWVLTPLWIPIALLLLIWAALVIAIKVLDRRRWS